MNVRKIFAAPALLILAAAVLLSGCGTGKGTGAAQAQTAQISQTAQPAQSGTVSEAPAAASGALSAAPAAVTASAEEEELFTARDLAQTADLSEAEVLTVSDGETLTVTKAGVYVLRGSGEGACVVVEAGEEDKVQLVLDGVSIVNADRPCILVEKADKVFLTSAQGSDNSFTVSGSFASEEDAALFSR